MGALRVRTVMLSVIALDLIEIHAYGQPPQAGAREIAVARLKTETVTHHYKCTAYGQYYTEIRAPADGYLSEVFVKESQAVKKGDPLFTIRPPRDEEKPKADDRDQADFAELGQAAIGNDQLFRLLPPEYFEKPKVDNPDRVISIRVPAEGLIGRLTRQPGREVRRGDLLTTVVHNSLIFAHFQIPEKDYLESAAA